MFAVTGNTFPVKDQLKALGGRWDAARKAWMVPADKATEALSLVNHGYVPGDYRKLHAYSLKQIHDAAAQDVQLAAAAHAAHPEAVGAAKAALDAASAVSDAATRAYDALFAVQVGPVGSEGYMFHNRRHTPALLALLDAVEQAGSAHRVAERAYDDFLSEQAIASQPRRGGW